MAVNIACPLCGAENSHASVFRGSHELVMCGKCRLVFSDRIANPKFFDFYSDNQDGFYESPYFQNVGPNPDDSNYREALSRALKNLTVEKPRLLDVGCGTGALLRVARSLGFDAEGLEVSAAVSEKVKQEFSIHIYNGRHEEFPNLQPFDAIAVWDVLEHLPDPVAFLTSLRRLLKPTGVLVLRTINEDCLLSQLSLLFYKASGTLFLAAAERMHEKYHVIYFTKTSLVATLNKAGYSVFDHWLGEFPASRASSSKLVQVALSVVYVFQRLFKRTYEQCIVASPST